MGAPGAGMMPPGGQMPPQPMPQQQMPPQFWNGKRAQERQIERTGQTRMDRLGLEPGYNLQAQPRGFSPGGKGQGAMPPSPNMALMAALQRRMGG